MTAQNTIGIQIPISGHFKMVAHGGKRGTVVLAEFDNIILNSGLNYVASGGLNTLDYCQVGSGTTAATASDVQLVSRIAGTNTQQSRTIDGSANTLVAGPPAYREGSVTYRFAVGAAAGNLSEVGVGWASTGSLFSRALIVDGGGAPTTITILSDEQLDVVYTIRVYIPNTDVTGSVVLAAVTYNYTLRASSWISSSAWSILYLLQGFVAGNYPGYNPKPATAYPGAIGLINTIPSGTPVDLFTSGQPVAKTYVTNSNQRACEYTFDLNQCNISGGIKSIVFQAYGASASMSQAYQVEFSPNIPKDATKVLKLTLMFSLARRFP